MWYNVYHILLGTAAEEYSASFAQFKTGGIKELLQGWTIAWMEDHSWFVGKRSGEDESQEDDKSPYAKAVIHHPRLVDTTECGTSKDTLYRRQDNTCIQKTQCILSASCISTTNVQVHNVSVLLVVLVYTAFSALGAFLMQVTTYTKL